MSRKRYDDDDGHVIAKMNVDGMPGSSSGPETSRQEDGDQPLPPPTKQELRSLMLNGLLAALAIAAVFGVAAALFILFCTNCWF